MPRKSLLLFILILLTAAMGFSRAFSAERFQKEMETLRRIATQVQDNYVTEVDTKKLFEGAYRGMLQTLDPYTQYLDQRETSSFAADTEGQFGGLGIEISLRDGILVVVAPIRGTPAYEAGILPGDIILKIDGKSTERITLDEAVRLLRGEVGTKVTLTIRHIGSSTDTDVTITRAIIQPAAVEYEMVDKAAGIGLMRVSSFSAKVIADMEKGLSDLQQQGLKGLILDVRQNPGGLLEKAVEMADLFLPEGVIVSVKGRRPEMTKVFSARKGQPLESLPLVLLVDEGSASASEILAGALKDHKRALIVGTRTYGKGSVQNVVPLGEGEALKLTTARYYTPSDKPIEDRQGIVPDIVVPMSREHVIALRNQEREDKLRNRYHLGGLLEEGDSPYLGAETERENQERKPEQEARRSRVVDIQLKAALNILRWQLASLQAKAR